jgi:hypothetical protein
MSFAEFALICTYSVISMLSQIKFFLDFPDATVLTLIVQATGEDGDTVARIAVGHLLHSLTDEVDRDTQTHSIH